MQYITIIASALSLIISAISLIKIFTSITERFVKIETKFNMFKDTVSEQNKESETERNSLLSKIHEHNFFPSVNFLFVYFFVIYIVIKTSFCCFVTCFFVKNKSVNTCKNLDTRF